jgi:hypothetical protein
MTDDLEPILNSLLSDMIRTISLARRCSSLFPFLLAICMGMQSANGGLVTLFTGSGLPSNQPWLIYGNDFAGTASQTSVSGGVQLSSDNTARAGYSNYIPLPIPILKNSSFPILDRTLGFELEFRARINSEAHISNNRAGFSVILLGKDAQGIEIGFWNDQVWAQNTGFTKGESQSFDTSVDRDYRLRITNDTYTLLESNQTLLSGSVRNYGTPSMPYALPNYLFLGDNTTSASANVTLGAIQLQSNLSSIPEPSSGMMIAAVATMAARWMFRRRRRPSGK